MENKLDLSTLSEEQVSKIMEIVENKEIGSKSEQIKEEWLKQNSSIKKSDEYEFMDLDIRSDIPFGTESPFANHKLDTTKKIDSETYKTIEKIHAHGTPKNFMSALRGIVESRREISISEVSDELDNETTALLIGK